MDEKNKLLLELARKSIESVFDENIKIDKDTLLNKFTFLKEIEASFVTLTKDGQLRGCIGSLVAHRILLEDIIHNSKAAAFNDPRFTPLDKDEYKQIKVEISLLTKPELLKYSDFKDLEEKLIPNKHGVILELDGKRATFLPQVWEQLPNFNDFMVHLCRKAGLNPSSLSALPKIFIYEAIKIKED
ncbi:AmmeMemoRadiSam system protein A [Halarcobacter sp.]|uniref:AmmeMemoRadiSam system protein A n=1 Tax=Halarcobacter sp. TaxID=2321133 RepID=UPI002AAB5DC4|nr:AmmeMemoRadiSam system protein A [Halarcobacter sp.]